jgi:hypothetical protein
MKKFFISMAVAGILTAVFIAVQQKLSRFSHLEDPTVDIWD